MYKFIKYNNKIWVVIIAVFICSSCYNENKSNKQLHYFDIKGFIEQEIEHFEDLNPTVSKHIVVNGRSELKQVTDLNWKKELAPFIKADINKTAWIGMYDADTIFTAADKKYFKKITYLAKEKNLSISKIVLYFIHKTTEPHKIIIFAKEDNILYTIYKQLILNSGYGYSINSVQKIIFMKESNFQVQAEIVTDNFID